MESFRALEHRYSRARLGAVVPAYVMVSVSSGVAWPEQDKTVSFGGRDILLVPPRRDANGELRAYPLAAIQYSRGENESELVNVIRRFLNALAWREQVSIREVDVTYGAPLRMGTRVPDNGTTADFDAKNLFDPANRDARIALAFYREGLDLKHIHQAYSFLSLFKVLNVRFGTPQQQIDWINANAGRLKNEDAVSRLSALTPTTADVGVYLYGSGRCAVAHAFATPVVDPNDIADQQRISSDWPLIRSCAALLLQAEYGLPAPEWGTAA